MQSMSEPIVPQEGQNDILQMAAQCFADRGYNATSVDEVARRLGCTKGRIYHFFASKADLFFSVYRVALKSVFEATKPIYESDAPAFERLHRMAQRHTVTIIKTQPFQRVAREGVEIYMRGATTPEQRETLAELSRIREEYSQLFRDVMEGSRANGDLNYPDTGIAVQLIFLSLNSPVYWYKNRPDQTEEDIEELAHQVVLYSLTGLGADRSRIKR